MKKIYISPSAKFISFDFETLIATSINTDIDGGPTSGGNTGDNGIIEADSRRRESTSSSIWDNEL